MTEPAPNDRSCDGCTLCCKVLEVLPINKPGNVLCEHCIEGRGCKIYPDRPEICRTFLCGYLSEPTLGPEWRPVVSHIVLTSLGTRMMAAVDPDDPFAWRREPYYSTLKQWARAGAKTGGRVMVQSGGNLYRILANGEIQLR